MAGIFPEGGVVPSQAQNGDNIVTTRCDDGARFYNTRRCAPSVDFAALNALISELGNAVNEAGVPYDCTRLDNLALAIRSLLDAYSPCGAPPATPAQLADITLSSPLVTCVNGDVVTVPASHFIPVPGAVTTPCNATNATAGQVAQLRDALTQMFVLLCITLGGVQQLRRVDGQQLRSILFPDWVDNEVQIVSQRGLTELGGTVNVTQAGQVLAVGSRVYTGNQPVPHYAHLGGVVEGGPQVPTDVIAVRDVTYNGLGAALIDVNVGDALTAVILSPTLCQLRLNGTPVMSCTMPATVAYSAPAAEAPRSRHYLPVMTRDPGTGAFRRTVAYTNIGPGMQPDWGAFFFIWRVR